MRWNDSYNLGIEVIDEQHKKFIGLINTLSKKLLGSADKKVVIAVLDELEHYAEMHFSTEEELFAKFDYVGKSEHSKKHQYFRDVIAKKRESINESKDDFLSAMDLLEFMQDWFLEHILKEDKQYVQCFQENGLK